MSTVRQSAETVSFGPRRLGHVNLFVDELNRSMDFYHQVCGLEEVAREAGIGAGFLSNGNTHHDVGLIQTTSGQALHGRDGQVQIPSGRGTEPGLNHLGWEMPNEAALVAAYRRAQVTDLAIHRLADHQISHSVYLFDPDGNLHEFYADAMRDWRGFFQGELDLITGVWEPDDRASAEPLYDPDPEIRNVPGALAHPLRISYAVLLTDRLQAMTSFFSDVAGLSVAHETRDKQCVCLHGAANKLGIDVALIDSGGAKSGLHHFGFELADADEVEQTKQRLSDADYRVVNEVDTPQKRALFVSDPDGLPLAFFARTETIFGALDRAGDARPLLV